MKYKKVKRAIPGICGILFAVAPCSVSGQTPGRLAAPSGGLISLQAIVVNPVTHNVYVVDTDREAVSIINGLTGSVTSASVGKDPVAIAVNPATNRIYVANHGSGTVSVLDGETNALLATIDVGRLPYVVAANAATNRIYVSNVFSDVLTVIDGATNAKTSIKAGSADAIAIDSQMESVYLLHYENVSLTRLDARTDAISSIPLGAKHLWGMALDAPAKILYIPRIGDADVVAMDETSKAMTVISVGKLPCAVAVNRTTNTAYVVNYGDDSVTVIGGHNHLAVATVHVGRRPQAAIVDERSNRVYIANTLGKNITVIDGATNAVIGALKTEGSPYALTIDPQTGRLYAATFGEPSFAVINPGERQKPAL